MSLLKRKLSVHGKLLNEKENKNAVTEKPFILNANKSAITEARTYSYYFVICQSPLPTALCIPLWILIARFCQYAWTGVYTDDKPKSKLTSLFTFNGRDAIIARD